jgi:hypothetical protein
MASTAVPKYRPVLSGDAILHIIKLAKRDGTKDSMELIATLARIEWQIKNGAISPAYITVPQASMIEDLGFDEPAQSSSNASAHVDSGGVTLEVLYGIWMKEPEALTAADIAKVRAYRYEQGKMTIDEEKLFEKEVLGLSL